MSSSITEFVMTHPLFDHHDHICTFERFEEMKPKLNVGHIEGYAGADVKSAAGTGPKDDKLMASRLEGDARKELWRKTANTGYARATDLTCRELFGMPFDPTNWDEISEKLKDLAKQKSNQELYDYCLNEKANIKWVQQDGLFRPEVEPDAEWEGKYPDYFRFAFRADALFHMTNLDTVELLERVLDRPIHSLDHLVDAMNACIDRYQATGRLAALKNGMAYGRTLEIAKPTRHEAEATFNRIRKGKAAREGRQCETSVTHAEGCVLGDYLLHKLFERAEAEDIPVQIHTGYLAGNWGPLAHTSVMHLVPVFQEYSRLRFDIFHASWPYTSELGCLAKEFPNVYPDLCWMWAMNPAHAGRALCEWLDGVPYTKIFGFGADTGNPFNAVGYAKQARIGISRVLEQKVSEGDFSPAMAEEVAGAIMLRNGEDFYHLGGAEN